MCGAEEIRNDRIGTALDSLEEQRGSGCIDHTTMNLCRFEIRVDFGVDDDDFFFAG
jgi:hypothetical protein